MIDIIEMIPSKDMREALRKQERRFTDMETATLVHNLGLPRERRRELLKQIEDETQDERLRAQIAFSLSDDQQKEEWFRTVTEGCAFGVREMDEEYPTEAMDAFFSSFELAFTYGLAMGNPFEIHKWRVLQELPAKKTWWPGDCGSMRFAANGTLKPSSLWATDDGDPVGDRLLFAPWPVGTEEENWPNYQFFEDRWVDLPNPYECGDLVRVLDGCPTYIDPAYEWAVVESDQERWQSFRERVNKWLAAVEAGCADPKGVMADFSDIQVTVELPCKDGTFAHDHINPMFLERVIEDAPEASDEAKLREAAVWAARGECDLEYLSHVLKGRILAAQAIQPQCRC